MERLVIPLPPYYNHRKVDAILLGKTSLEIEIYLVDDITAGYFNGMLCIKGAYINACHYIGPWENDVTQAFKQGGILEGDVKEFIRIVHILQHPEFSMSLGRF